MVDQLRVSRAMVDRTLERLRECTAEAREDEERYDVGPCLEGLIDDLEDGGCESLDEVGFERKARLVIDCVIEAVDCDDDDEEVPESPTWGTFRALSKAMKQHAAALKRLREAELQAMPRKSA